MRRSLEERFWSKVNKLGIEECWEWEGALNKGYGVNQTTICKANRGITWSHVV